MRGVTRDALRHRAIASPPFRYDQRSCHTSLCSFPELFGFVSLALRLLACIIGESLTAQGNRMKHVPGTAKPAVDDAPRSGVGRTPQPLGVGVFYRRPSRLLEETPAVPAVRMLGALYRIALAGGFR